MNSFYFNQLNKLNVLWAKQQRKFGSNKQKLQSIGHYSSKKKGNREMWEEKQEYYELKPGKTVEVQVTQLSFSYMRIKALNQPSPLRVKIQVYHPDQDNSIPVDVYVSSIKKHPNKFRAEHLFLSKNFKIEVSKKSISQTFPNDLFYFSVFSTEMLILGVRSYFGNGEGLGTDGIWFTKKERDASMQS